MRTGIVLSSMTLSSSHVLEHMLYSPTGQKESLAAITRKKKDNAVIFYFDKFYLHVYKPL